MSNSAKNSILSKYNGYFSSLRASSLARDISKVYGGDVLARIIGLATALLLIRGLAVSDYAAYTAFNSVLFLIPGIIGAGINSALVRFSAEHISRTGRKPLELYFINVIFQFVVYTFFCFLLVLMADRVSTLLFGRHLFHSALVYGMIAGLGYLITESGRGVYKAEQRFGVYVKTLWLRQILVFTFICSLYLTKHFDFTLCVQSITIAELLVAAVVTINVFRDLDFGNLRVSLNTNIVLIKDFFSSSTWLIGYSLVLTCFSRLDIFMLSHLSSKQEIAMYGVAFRFYSLGLLLLSSIHAVLLPKFSKIDMQDPERQRQFTWKWVRAIGWIIIPIILADAFFKPFFIWIVGAEYEKAYNILVVFSFGIWLSLTFSPLTDILKSRKAFTFLVALALGAFTINFTGNYLLIPIWGGMGAALITIISHGFINVTSAMRVCLSTK